MFRPFLAAQLVYANILPLLQNSNIRDDGPAVAGRHLRSMVRHRTIAVGNDIEHPADRHLAQPVNMVGWRSGETAFDDLTVAVAERVVASRTEDHEPLAAALQHLASKREGKSLDIVRLRLGIL